MIVLTVLDYLTISNDLSCGPHNAKWGQFYRRKGENLDFRLFFEFECLNMLDIADYDRSNDSGLFYSHLLPVSMA